MKYREDFDVLKATYDQMVKSFVSFPQFDASKFIVPLIPDPSLVGLSTVNQTLAVIQQKKDTLLDVFGRVADFRDQMEALNKKAEGLFGRERDYILMNDPDVSNLKNAMMMTGYVNNQLDEFVKFRIDLQYYVDWLNGMYESIKRYVLNLESTNSNASRQLTTIQFQIEIGEIHRNFPNQNSNLKPSTPNRSAGA
jgi:hypothetical protein